MLLLAHFCSAQSNEIEPATAPLQISQLFELGFNQNPAILAAKAKWSQTIETYPQETALEDPMLSFSYYVENVETRVGPQEYAIGISQRIPFPGTLRQKGKIVDKEIEMARLAYEKAVRDFIADLKQAVYELQYLDGAIGITQKNKELLEEILIYAQARYADGSGSLNSVLQAESQLAQLDYDLITVRELRVVQQSVINAILNQPPDTPLPAIAASIPQPATFEIAVLENFVQENNQDIQMANVSVGKADESIKLAKKQNRPMFNFGVNYINTGEALNPLMAESGKDPIIVSAGISVPVWIGKNKARVRYAEEQKDATQHQADSVKNQWQVKLRQTLFQLQNAMRQVTLYQDHLIPQAQHSMAVAEEWNRTKEGSVSENLEVQSVWLNFNLAALRARVDYAQKFAELERIAGGSLSPLLNPEVNHESN
jgi:outer membrane protein TolC